jgi:hypothetical protein
MIALGGQETGRDAPGRLHGARARAAPQDRGTAAYFELVENEGPLAAFVCGKPEDWPDALTAESLLDICEAAHDLNFQNARRWAERRARSDGGAPARGRNGAAREAGLGDCLADGGLALGKTPAEIAQSVSLPELFLVLRRSDRKEVDRLLVQMDVAFLSAAARGLPRPGGCWSGGGRGWLTLMPSDMADARVSVLVDLRSKLAGLEAAAQGFAGLIKWLRVRHGVPQRAFGRGRGAGHHRAWRGAGAPQGPHGRICVAGCSFFGRRWPT